MHGTSKFKTILIDPIIYGCQWDFPLTCKATNGPKVPHTLSSWWFTGLPWFESWNSFQNKFVKFVLAGGYAYSKKDLSEYSMFHQAHNRVSSFTQHSMEENMMISIIWISIVRRVCISVNQGNCNKLHWGDKTASPSAVSLMLSVYAKIWT